MRRTGVGEDKEGTVSAFAINRADGQLTLLNTVRSGGRGPTYVSVHPSGKFLLVANYFGGSVAVLPILPDGRSGRRHGCQTGCRHGGTEKGHERSAGKLCLQRTRPYARAHDSSRSLGTLSFCTSIWAWTGFSFGSSMKDNGVLTPNDPPAVSLPPGDGPRHFAFHPNGRWCYSLQEEARTSSCSTTTPGRAGSLLGKPSPACRPVSPAAISARRFWCLAMAGSSMPATVCTTASGYFRDRSEWGTDIRQRRMDSRELSAELQFRSHRPVPLFLQPAGRQHRTFPRGSSHWATGLHRPLHARSAIRRASFSSIFPGRRLARGDGEYLCRRATCPTEPA